jgi:transposase-like protein
MAAARRFVERAIGLHDVPVSIMTDKSGAHTAVVCGLIANRRRRPSSFGNARV